MEVKDIYDLIDKLDKSSLTNFKYKKGDFEVSIKKEKEREFVTTTLSAPAAVHVPSDSVGSSVQTQHLSEDDGLEIITAPLVGTFYRAPAPDAPPFVEEGEKVSSGATLCILEAMKMMNEFEADFDCEIVRILVENSTMVEYGTPLFKVKRV